MGERFDSLSQPHIKFIEQQHLFFVGTAAVDGLINVSPKGMDTFRVLDESTALWMNMTGSGNETAAHVLESDRMTVMFCSFEVRPLILRLYGHADLIHAWDEDWAKYIDLFEENHGARQLFRLRIKMVQTSCGYGVPYFDMKGQRPTLSKWTEKKGRDGVEEYWVKKNTKSLDGKDTGIRKATKAEQS